MYVSSLFFYLFIHQKRCLLIIFCCKINIILSYELVNVWTKCNYVAYLWNRDFFLFMDSCIKIYAMFSVYRQVSPSPFLNSLYVIGVFSHQSQAASRWEDFISLWALDIIWMKGYKMSSNASIEVPRYVDYFGYCVIMYTTCL